MDDNIICPLVDKKLMLRIVWKIEKLKKNLFQMNLKRKIIGKKFAKIVSITNINSC